MSQLPKLGDTKRRLWLRLYFILVVYCCCPTTTVSFVTESSTMTTNKNNNRNRNIIHEPRRSKRILRASTEVPYARTIPSRTRRHTQLLFSGQLPIETAPTFLFTFGIVADIQYANVPDGTSYGGIPRFYRHSLQVAQHAAQQYQDERVSLVINLGDIVDGKAQDLQAHGGEPIPSASGS